MFTKVELRNFQSHEKTVFEFDKGVNAIIGPSDSGKTAILRAVRWVIWNRPLGDAFRSDWGGDTSVTVQVPDNTIVRWKHDKEHGYTVNGTKLTAIKTDVPEEVTKILNIDTINLQQQFDRPFLLDDSAGEVASHFNRIAHLDVIGTTMKTLASWQRQLNLRGLVHLDKIKECTSEISKFDFLPDMEEQIKKAEQFQIKMETLDSDVVALSKLVSELEDIALQIEELNPVLELEKDVAKYMALRDNKIATLTRKGLLDSLVNELNIVFTVLCKLEALTTKETSVNKALKLYNDIQEAQETYNQLDCFIRSIKETNDALYNSINEVEKSEDTFHKMFPDVCPLCGAKVE